jgi:hypothetical protein
MAAPARLRVTNLALLFMNTSLLARVAERRHSPARYAKIGAASERLFFRVKHHGHKSWARVRLRRIPERVARRHVLRDPRGVSNRAPTPLPAPNSGDPSFDEAAVFLQTRFGDDCEERARAFQRMALA